jgi:integrase/recombinase XerC
MEKERGMEERPSPPALQEFGQLSRRHFFSPQNQGVIADYFTHLRARHYAPALQEGTIRALKRFAVLMPEARQAALYADLTQTTPGDLDAWIEPSFRHQLAPGTVATRLRLMQGFFAFLGDQGYIAQSPIRLPRHSILVPQDLPRPMAADEVIAFFRVIDALRDRTMFLLMLRCGLRVGEASRLLWSALDLAQGTVRIENSKGHVDRVVYLAPDVAKALWQWHRLQAVEARYVFPSRLTRKGGMPLSARPIRNRMTRDLKRAGITKAYSPPSRRQTFASNLLEPGAEVVVIRDFLGHSQIAATERYAKVSSQKIKQE